MPPLRIHRAGMEELELLIRSRVDFCLRDHPANPEEVAAFRPQVEAWTRSNLENGNYHGYFGFLGDDLVCCAGLLLYTLPPLVRHFDRKQGHVLTFFTYPEFRSQGIGRALMNFIVQDAKALGVQQLVLNATPMGEPLYEKTGFSDPKFRNLVLSIE